MSAQSDPRNWRFGPRAVTLAVAYLLVLQGIAIGGATGMRAGGRFADAICFSKSVDALGGSGPATPSRHARHDGCCVFHSAAAGAATAVSPFVGETPPSLSYVKVKLAFDQSRLRADPATPPLGSRAPPYLI